MKFILFLLSFVVITNVNYYSTFTSEVEEAYSAYTTIVEKENQYYSIKVIQGLMNDKVYSGVYFRSDSAKDYTIKIILKNKTFNLKADSRGDVSVLAINTINDFELVIVNSDNIIQHPNPIASIKYMSKEEFLNQDGVTFINGAGKSTTLTNLNLDTSSDIGRIILFGVLIFISLVCITVLIIFFITKKGMFNNQTRKEGTFDFKKFINETITEVPSEYARRIYDEEDENKTDYNNPTNNQEEVKNTYYYTKNIEDEYSDFDIKSYLQEKGYIVDYRMISEEEKNKIMVELMILKDTKKITLDDYYKETNELWRK